MTTRTVARLDRLARRPVEKFNERRAELADAALQTLAELGYARTSVREIAQNSAFSHGVLHYYFNDKVDLILCSVRQYKARCITRYDDVVARSRSVDELVDGFLDALGRTLQDEAHLHRLWYDIRAQAMFDVSFQADIAEIDNSLELMIWRIMERYFALAGVAPTLSSSTAYAIMDGLFQQALLRRLSGHAKAVAKLQTDIRDVLSRIVAT
jgi:AcrR family transcriptional regulator